MMHARTFRYSSTTPNVALCRLQDVIHSLFCACSLCILCSTNRLAEAQREELLRKSVLVLIKDHLEQEVIHPPYLPLQFFLHLLPQRIRPVSDNHMLDIGTRKIALTELLFVVTSSNTRTHKQLVAQVTQQQLTSSLASARSPTHGYHL